MSDVERIKQPKQEIITSIALTHTILKTSTDIFQNRREPPIETRIEFIAQKSKLYLIIRKPTPASKWRIGKNMSITWFFGKLPHEVPPRKRNHIFPAAG